MLTTLPFSGFYNSKWSNELDNVENNFIENEAENDDILDESEISAIVDKCRQYGTQIQYVAQEYVDYFNETFKEEFGIALGLRFESMKSPREYNFTSDVIYAYIDEDVVRRLLDDLEESKLADMIRERFTSCDGFISFYPNRIERWKEKPLEEWDYNEVGTVLEAYVAQVEDFEWGVYYEMCERHVLDTALDKGMDWDKYRELCDDRRKEIEEELAEEEALADADPDKRLYPDKPLDLVQYVTDFCRMNHLKE